MFHPWSVLTINIILAVFRFLLINAVASVLSIYSRFGGKYANSIRWTSRNGYIESIKSLWNSRKHIPASVKFAMLATTAAYLVAGLADNGVALLIYPRERPNNANYTVTSVPHFLSTAVEPTFHQWRSTIRSDDDIVDAIKSMTNDTRVIPNRVAGRVYTPKEAGYDPGCSSLNVTLNFGIEDLSNPNIPLSTGGCASIILVQHSSIYPIFSDMKITNVTKDRWSITTPHSGIQKNKLYEFSSSSIVAYSDQLFLVGTSGGYSPVESPTNGIIREPNTRLLKHELTTQEVVVTTMTDVRFTASSVGEFSNASKAVFGPTDDLFQAMELSINKNRSMTYEGAYFAELSVNGSDFNALTCYSAISVLQGNTTVLVCSFIHFQMIVTKPLPMDPVLMEARNGRSMEYYIFPTMMMSFDYIPDNINGILQPIPLDFFKHATSAATKYIASVGRNQYLDWGVGLLYVLFDTTDTQSGFEIPVWLEIAVLGIMALCLCLWITTYLFLDSAYTSTLFSIAVTRVSYRLKMKAPMLISFDAHLMQMEDTPIILRYPESKGDAEALMAPLTPYQL